MSSLSDYTKRRKQSEDAVEATCIYLVSVMPLFDAVFDQIVSSRGKSRGKLLTGSPKDEFSAYVWRYVRFFSGLDTSFPMLCHFKLQNWIDEHGKKELCNVMGPFDTSGKVIMDWIEEKYINPAIDRLNLSKFGASIRYKGLLY